MPGGTQVPRHKSLSINRFHQRNRLVCHFFTPMNFGSAVAPLQGGVTITGGSSSYSAASSKLEFDLLNPAGTQQGKLVYTGGGTWTAAATGNGACLTGSGSACPGTTYASLPANTQWTLQIVAVADAGAATNVATIIYIAVDVQ